MTFTVVTLTCCVEVVVVPVALLEVRVVPPDVETDDFELDWLDPVFVVEEADFCPVPKAKYPVERTRMRTRVSATTPVIRKLRLIFDVLQKEAVLRPQLQRLLFLASWWGEADRSSRSFPENSAEMGRRGRLR